MHLIQLLDGSGCIGSGGGGASILDFRMIAEKSGLMYNISLVEWSRLYLIVVRRQTYQDHQFKCQHRSVGMAWWRWWKSWMLKDKRVCCCCRRCCSNFLRSLTKLNLFAKYFLRFLKQFKFSFFLFCFCVRIKLHTAQSIEHYDKRVHILNLVRWSVYNIKFSRRDFFLQNLIWACAKNTHP